MLNFVKLKQGSFKQHAFPYWTYSRKGDIEKFALLDLSTSAWDIKSRFNQSDSNSENRAVDTELTVPERFLVSS